MGKSKILVVAALMFGSLVWLAAQGDVMIDADDIGGVVTSSNGPEAGVWVIAETTDLPTKFARVVVTDEAGRYVVPDLPAADYEVFVRGYGLVDSPRREARPGQPLALAATVAPNARAAAQVYPAAWWLTMIEPPADIDAQLEFALTMKQCYDCHQVGNKATREILPAMQGRSGSSLDVWTRRTGVGPSGPGMASQFRNLGDMRQALADWTDRIAAGEAPTDPPPRPQGVERNLVITLWDWGSEIDGRTDMAAADIRDGAVNANGLVYGVAEMTDSLTILDPATHSASVVKVPSSASVVEQGFNASPTRSPHYGERVWARRADVRSSAIDARGRAWMASRVREPDDQPDFCTSDENPFGRYHPLERASRQVSVYDPETEQFEQIDTCFSADHNQMSDDNFLYFGQNDAVGWVDMDVWDETHDAEAAQGWCPAVVDTNGDGRITEWTEPDEPVVPTMDHRVSFGCYSVAVSHTDGSLWCSGIGRGAKRLVRIEKGSNPPETCSAQYYEPPPDLMGGCRGVGGRGGGRSWSGLAELAGERPLLELRSGVVRHHQRSAGHRSELSRRVVLSAEGRPHVWHRLLSCERELSGPHGLSQHVGSRCGRTDLRFGQHRRDGGALARHRWLRDAPRALSAGLLSPFGQRPYRRPERRLEGERLLGELLHLRDLAYRGWQGRGWIGCLAQGRQVPDASRPARPLDRLT